MFHFIFGSGIIDFLDDSQIFFVVVIYLTVPVYIYNTDLFRWLSGYYSIILKLIYNPLFVRFLNNYFIVNLLPVYRNTILKLSYLY